MQLLYRAVKSPKLRLCRWRRYYRGIGRYRHLLCVIVEAFVEEWVIERH